MGGGLRLRSMAVFQEIFALRGDCASWMETFCLGFAISSLDEILS